MLLFIFFALYVTVLRNKLSEQYCLDGVFINIICIELFHQPTLMHSFLYSLTICLLHYYPRHVSSINMPIFRRKKISPLSTSVLCRRLQRAKITDAV